jgi:hypothetical protein
VIAAAGFRSIKVMVRLADESQAPSVGLSLDRSRQGGSDILAPDLASAFAFPASVDKSACAMRSSRVIPVFD